MNQIQIGKFIAELRKEKHMTQEELGEKIGVTNKTISRWENGNYMPDISVMQSLCKILDISINELISGRHLNEAEYKENADNNLISSFNQIRNIRREKKIIDFLNGTGTGLLISVLYSPDSPLKTMIIVVALVMIGIGWYRKEKYDKYVIIKTEQKNDICNP